jgi:hypothetical protein
VPISEPTVIWRISAIPDLSAGRRTLDKRGFDLAMWVRNAVRRPPFVMYYRTCPLSVLRHDLTASGCTVTTLPLMALGRRQDGIRCGLAGPRDVQRGWAAMRQ